MAPLEGPVGRTAWIFTTPCSGQRPEGGCPRPKLREGGVPKLWKGQRGRAEAVEKERSKLRCPKEGTFFEVTVGNVRSPNYEQKCY